MAQSGPAPVRFTAEDNAKFKPLFLKYTKKEITPSEILEAIGRDEYPRFQQYCKIAKAQLAKGAAERQARMKIEAERLAEEKATLLDQKASLLEQQARLEAEAEQLGSDLGTLRLDTEALESRRAILIREVAEAEQSIADSRRAAVDSTVSHTNGVVVKNAF